MLVHDANDTILRICFVLFKDILHSLSICFENKYTFTPKKTESKTKDKSTSVVLESC